VLTIPLDVGVETVGENSTITNHVSVQDATSNSLKKGKEDNCEFRNMRRVYDMESGAKDDFFLFCNFYSF